MATIALYADKINQMPGLIRGAKSAVSNLNTQLDTLKRKCQKVSVNVCNIEDVINTISGSTRTQEEKIETLETFCEDVEQFAQDAVNTDENVAELVNKNKDDFYDKYSYLKPDCEKTAWEKFCEGLKKVGEWCREHWASIVTVLVVIAAAVAIVVATVATCGAAAVLLAAGVGLIVGLLGQLIGDVIGFIRTGKWESTLADYIGALFGGAIGGILTMVCGPVVASGIDSLLSSLLSDSLNDLFGGEKKSLEAMWLDATVDGLVSAAFSKLLKPVSDRALKFVSGKIPILKRLAGKGSYDSSFNMVLTKLKNGTFGWFTYKSIRNGVISNLSGDLFKNILSGLGLMEYIGKGFRPIAKEMLIRKMTPGVMPTPLPFSMPGMGPAFNPISILFPEAGPLIRPGLRPVDGLRPLVSG